MRTPTHTQLIKAKTVTCSQEWCTHSYMEFVACISPIQVHTHSSECWTHTHTHTHSEQWGAFFFAAAPREGLGVRCLAKGHLSCG